MSQTSSLNYSFKNSKCLKNKSYKSSKKDFDKECYDLKVQLREFYGGECLEIVKLQEREISIFRERLRNAGLDDTLSSSQLEQSAIFRINEHSTHQEKEFHSKFQFYDL